jgi:hypothetical protein
MAVWAGGRRRRAPHLDRMRRLQEVRDVTLAASGLAVLLLGGCAGGDSQVAEGVYCYRSLADHNCFVRPVAENRDQLLGYVGPPPPRPIQRGLGEPLDLPPPLPRGWRDSGPDTISR